MLPFKKAVENENKLANILPNLSGPFLRFRLQNSIQYSQILQLNLNPFSPQDTSMVPTAIHQKFKFNLNLNSTKA